MNCDFNFWISKLNDPNGDEVQASIDMLALIMSEEAVPSLLKLMRDHSRSDKIRLSAAEAVSTIAGEDGRRIIIGQLGELETSEERRLFDIALRE